MTINEDVCGTLTFGYSVYETSTPSVALNHVTLIQPNRDSSNTPKPEIQMSYSSRDSSITERSVTIDLTAYHATFPDTIATFSVVMSEADCKIRFSN